MTATVSSFVSALMRGVAGVVYPGKTASLPIIVHHRVLEQPDPLLPDTIDARTLDEHFEMLARLFTVLPLDEAVDMAAKVRCRAAPSPSPSTMAIATISMSGCRS